MFWKCIEELEQRDFKVLTSTCDGASHTVDFTAFIAGA